MALKCQVVPITNQNQQWLCPGPCFSPLMARPTWGQGEGQEGQNSRRVMQCGGVPLYNSKFDVSQQSEVYLNTPTSSSSFLLPSQSNSSHNRIRTAHQDAQTHITYITALSQSSSSSSTIHNHVWLEYDTPPLPTFFIVSIARDKTQIKPTDPMSLSQTKQSNPTRKSTVTTTPTRDIKASSAMNFSPGVPPLKASSFMKINNAKRVRNDVLTQPRYPFLDVPPSRSTPLTRCCRQDRESCVRQRGPDGTRWR